MGEYLKNGRSLEKKETERKPVQTFRELTILELCAAYIDHVEECDGRQEGYGEGSTDRGKQVIKRLRRFCGSDLVSTFGPKRFKEFRQSLVDEGLSRTCVNDLVEQLKHVFRWGKDDELIPLEAWTALRDIKGLRKGQAGAREPKPVGPVADDVVEKTLEYVGPVVAAMIRLQRLTGMRPGEVCIMRPCDIERDGEVWFYIPEHHKTEHKGKTRCIALGPKSQSIIAAYLDRDPEACCFSPKESEEMRYLDLRRQRKTKVYPSQVERAKQRHLGPRKYKPHYDRQSYYTAIRRAVDAANRARKKAAAENGAEPELLPHWGPNRLRHAAATKVRELFTLDEARAMLGHTTTDMTEHYAKVDRKKAEAVARQIG